MVQRGFSGSGVDMRTEERGKCGCFKERSQSTWDLWFLISFNLVFHSLQQDICSSEYLRLIQPQTSTTWKFPQTCPAGTGPWVIIVLDASCGSSVWSGVMTLWYFTDSFHGQRIKHFKPAATHKLKPLHFTPLFFFPVSTALFIPMCLLTEESFQSIHSYYDLRCVAFYQYVFIQNGFFTALSSTVLEFQK